ncbi:hypothetical protein HA402_001402 [Bradysia odoriphaga]|nr:hypothetical protein HA402_001402 [Bradysia odoriphaga]
MIGLNRQIFRFNNVRTFFLSVSNTSPKGNTKTRGFQYEFEDDPKECQGRAHLLEHVICQAYVKKRGYLDCDCETMYFQTKFTFSAASSNYQDTIRAWTETMFKDDPIDKNIMTLERGHVDKEYLEKRNNPVFTADRTAEILKKKDDITLAQFGWGNLNTLSRLNDDELMTQLKECRKLYCQRPLNVCVYSGHEIQMNVVTHLLDVEGSITKERRRKAKEPNWEERLKSVEAPSLVLLQSANDSKQFDIIYPFHKKLSLSEEDTFEIIGDLINRKFAGQLGHVLFEKKLASECWGAANLSINSFVVTIRLTADGLKRIRQVTSAVHDYFQFLRNNWRKIDRKALIESNRKINDAESGLDYADSIARCLDRVNKSFDEEDLFRPLSSPKEQQLISKQILNNKSIRYTIAARDLDDVYKTLAENAALVAKGNIETAANTGTKFHFSETGLFAAPNNFTLPQLKPQPGIEIHENALFYITKASDAAFMALCEHYLQKKTEHLVAGLKLGPDGKEYGVNRSTDGRISLLFDSEDYKKYIHHPENSTDFDNYKQSLMETYSLTMTNSMNFAKSLMETALKNFTRNIKLDSIPLQYNVLKGMDYVTYINHFQKLNGKDKIDYAALDILIPESKEFIIDSINSDESTTVTLVFLQQPETTDPKILEKLWAFLQTELTPKLFPSLYTCTWEYAKFGAAKGILLTLVSVEGKPDQTGEKILELLGDKMNKEVETNFGANSGVGKLWTHMTNHRIIIQADELRDISVLILGWLAINFIKGAGDSDLYFKSELVLPSK